MDLIDSTRQKFNSLRIVKSWGLSNTAALKLCGNHELVEDLDVEREKASFPAKYTPREIQVLFDDIVYVCVENGLITYLRKCGPSHRPAFIEWRFDDQCAYFHVGNEIVVNRLKNIANLDIEIGRLDSYAAVA